MILSNPDDFPNAPAAPEYRAFLGDGTAATFYVPHEHNGDSTSENHANFRRHKRRAIAPLLGQATNANRKTAMEEITHRATAVWMPSQVVDVHAVLHELFFQIALRCLFQIEVSDAVLAANATLRQTAGQVAAYVQSSQNRLLPYFDRGKALSPAWETQQSEQYAQLRARRQSLDLILDSMLVAVERGLRSPLLEQVRTLPLNDEADFRAVLGGLLMASYENSAAWGAWVMECLADRADLQNEIAEESRTSRENMLLSLCLSEALRLYPPVWSFARRAKRDLVLTNESMILKGNIILVSPYVQQRHPLLWEGAAQFNPRRFAIDDAPGIGRYCPFGHGLYGCYGEAFARDSVRAVLSALLREWRFSPVLGHPAPEVAFGITLFPLHGIWLRVERRD